MQDANLTEQSRGEELLRSLRFFATSPGTARQAGLWRYAFERQGVQLATTDCLIAAIAHERGASLVTGNLNDYPMLELRRLPLPRRQRGSG
jgi:predicted nucleic acid-binding protein